MKGCGEDSGLKKIYAFGSRPVSGLQKVHIVYVTLVVFLRVKCHV
jgi:hypothetical protein